MLKNIIVGVLFVGLAAVLVWGGINRTMAKSGTSFVPGSGLGNRSQYGDTSFESEYGESAQYVGNTVLARNGRGGLSDCDANGDCNVESSGVGARGAQRYQDSSEFGTGGGKGQGGGGWGGGRGGGGSFDPLSEEEIEALESALDSEYRALSKYRSMIDTFGEVLPFTEVAQAEQNHINALLRQFNKYAIPVPENPWDGNIEPYGSISQACQAGVDTEIKIASLYEELLAMTDNAALQRVFTNLHRASIESHLPEFETCN